MPELLRPRHDGKAMFFPCIDDYFTEYNNRRRQELGQPFGPSLAGGGLAFLLEGSQTASCMQIATGCVISGTTDFYIVSHQDCGAYNYFAGINWEEYPESVQIATLWRDLHIAERIVREFLRTFSSPLDSDWRVPEVHFRLQVVSLGEQLIPEPDSLTEALSLDRYREIRVPRQLRFQ